MASDRAQFNRALRKWDELSCADEFSSADGEAAILCSGYTEGDTAEEHRMQLDVFETEADVLATCFHRDGIGAFVLKHVSYHDIVDVLRDRYVSHVVTIGHGNLSSFWISDDEVLDWRAVAHESDHLKSGLFVQRHCGNQIRNLNVPVGTFAMDSHAKVLAAANQYIPSSQLSYEYESKIKPLHNRKRLDYQTIKRMFAYDDAYKNQ